MKIELLAPAGNLEKLKFAFHYGADAVYIGGKNYSLRANANNFSELEIKEAVLFAHLLNKKVYVTVNIVFHEIDLIGLEEYLKFLAKVDVDAIIISDPYVVQVVRDNNINLNLFLSTQTSTLNKYAAKFWINLGIKRIVIAREALREDIKSIIDANVETECFIHGAMCTSFSGKCVMSNYITNRDSNRGGCAQICRFLFDIEDSVEKFTMMPKDLNMVSYIEEMIKIGITSLKIEGRMRSMYYLATVIDTYRKIINKINSNNINPSDLEYATNILNRCANRESVPQFFDHYPSGEEQYFLSRNEISNQDFLGLVLECQNGLIKIEQRNYFKVNDEVQFFGPKTDSIDFKIIEILDDKLNPKIVANHPGEIIYLKSNISLAIGDIMRIKIFDNPDLL